LSEYSIRSWLFEVWKEAMGANSELYAPDFDLWTQATTDRSPCVSSEQTARTVSGMKNRAETVVLKIRTTNG
jgi:hypothetical protein